jgi:hypothetical protein
MKSVPKYWIYFTREPMSLQNKDMDMQVQELKQLLTLSIWHCPWIDAFGYSLKVRKDAVPKALQFIKNIRVNLHNNGLWIRNKPSSYNPIVSATIRCSGWISTSTTTKLVDGSLHQLQQNSSLDEEFLEQFVTEGNNSKSTTIPTYWFRTVKAT